MELRGQRPKLPGNAAYDLIRQPNDSSGKRGAVIIIIYNRLDDIHACLDSLARHLPEDVALIVVDNASTEPLAARLAAAYPRVHLVRTRRNLGYAGGNNVGAMHALLLGAPLLYFLNDDTEVTKAFWEACEQTMRSDGASLVGSILVDYANPRVMQIAGVHIDLKNIVESYRGVRSEYGDDYTANYQCDAVFGAGFMIEAKLFATLGGFDKSYFHLCEEIDLCLRAKRHGSVVAFAGKSIIKHKGGGSLSYVSPRYTFFLYRNKLWLWKRHTSAAVFWTRAPKRIGRLMVNQIAGKSWLPTNLRTLFAAVGGVFVGFFWWRRPSIDRSLQPTMDSAQYRWGRPR